MNDALTSYTEQDGCCWMCGRSDRQLLPDGVCAECHDELEAERAQDEQAQRITDQ